jgi:Protein of unknown function (DUF4199)
MKIPLKFGLLITAGVIVWIVIAHLLFPNPRSTVHSVGAGIFFNLMEIVGIALGIRAKQAEQSGMISFKTGVKTGVAIAVVYAVTASLFFLVQMAFIGTEMLAHEPGAGDKPLWQVAVGAFAGLTIGAIVMGLIYSTLVTFFVVKNQKGRVYQ